MNETTESDIIMIMHPFETSHRIILSSNESILLSPIMPIMLETMERGLLHSYLTRRTRSKPSDTRILATGMNLRSRPASHRSEALKTWNWRSSET